MNSLINLKEFLEANCLWNRVEAQWKWPESNQSKQTSSLSGFWLLVDTNWVFDVGGFE